MDLIKKKFEKKKKKARGEKKKQSKTSKTKAKKKQKQKRRTTSKHSSSSSESSEDSDESARKRLRAVASKLAVDAANIDKRFRMAGSLVKKPENPPDFNRRLFEAEWKEMRFDESLPIENMKSFDNYLKSRAELKSTDHVVLNERLDVESKKSSRLKILTKYDEGRFAAIYMVQNESAVNNDVVAIQNNRFMMKTALRQLSSNQIYLRLTREINTLKCLWLKKDEIPPRIPQLFFEGRMLGLPFYVTAVYDVNLEKCREEMGGGCFSSRSAFHVAREVLSALAFLHIRQIVHRDVKPTNVVLNLQNRDQWYLIDYGDAIATGKTVPTLSPPDGITLPFLSREAHDQLLVPAPTTFQQDLESWFLLLIDMMKPLSWRENKKIEAVGVEKQQFFKNLPKFLAYYPKQALDIGLLLKTDQAPYREITKRVGECLREPGWVPEWYDRAATKAARALESRRKKQLQKARKADNTTTTTTTTFDEEEKRTTPDKRDRSVYLATPTESPMNVRKVGKKMSREASDVKPESAGGTNKVATFVDEPAVAVNNERSVYMNDLPTKANKTATYVEENAAPTPQKQDRSVYFNEFPMASPMNDPKRKYRYKAKK